MTTAEIEQDLWWDHFQGQGAPSAEAPEDDDVECQGCGKSVRSKSDLAWIGNGWDYMGCATCVAECNTQLEAERADLLDLEANEPDCTCAQSAVDLFDPRGCEFHDDRSPWNTRRRALTARERYEHALGDAA